MNKSSKLKHYLFNLISSYGYSLISIIIGIFSVPIALRYWQSIRYGIWTIIISFSIYLSASSLGIDVATGLLMTKNSQLEIKRIILKRGIFATIIFVIIAFAFLIGINFFFPNWIHIIGKMDAKYYDEAKKTATIFILFFLINLPFSVISNAFASYGKAYISNIFNTILVFISFFALIIAVFFKLSLPVYGIIYGFFILLINIIKVAYFYLKIYEKVDISVTKYNEDCKYSTIIKTGFRLILYGIALLASSNISNLIISNNLTVSDVIPYSVLYRLFNYAFNFLYSFNIASSPLLGKEYGENNWDWIKETYNSLFVSTIFISSLFVAGGILFLKEIISIWIGVNNYPGFLIVLVLSLWFFCNGLSNFNYVIINAFNYTKGIPIVTWSESLVFICLSLLLIKKIGIIAIPFSMLVSSMLTSVWLLPVIISKRTSGRLQYNFYYLFKILGILILFIIGTVIIQKYVINIQILFLAKFCYYIIYLLLSINMLPSSLKKRFNIFYQKIIIRFKIKSH